MFDNLLYQSASSLLSEDIRKNCLPNSILFAGPAASGKLTCALELARVLACRRTPRGEWNCTCPSCLRNKALVSQNVLVCGPGDRTLEIAAAKTTLLNQSINNTSHVEAARYLYLRAVRKLTVRFSPVLWEGDSSLAKFSPLLQSINDSLELLEPGRTLPDEATLTKILDSVGEQCEKLENSFLYNALPVSQIRRFSAWAHLSSGSGQKVLIIENADCMEDSSRNALLKILEEPPEAVTFILTTTKRGAMLPTILSRVRTYNFFERTAEQQKTVISRVFRQSGGGYNSPVETVSGFLQTYLPVKPDTVKEYAASYFETLAQGHVPDIASIIKGCGNFDPRLLLNIFFAGIIDSQKKLLATPAGAEASSQILVQIRKVYNNINMFNQNALSAFEELTRELLQINFVHGGIFREALE